VKKTGRQISQQPLAYAKGDTTDLFQVSFHNRIKILPEEQFA